MVTKAQIQNLVDEGAIEQKLQSLIKQDLSIFAEMYATPKDEYICFSEFQIGDGGSVDFAVFTYRSKMSVFLIEVKGANFNLVTKSGTFNADFLEGIDQIIMRMDYIKRNYSKFRTDMHDIREKVESGRLKYNSLLCPVGKLHVDPRKDINVHYIVIGGKTVNDLEESCKKNSWESRLGIKLESWDSWLGKVKRD